jgi:hypothetical protein
MFSLSVERHVCNVCLCDGKLFFVPILDLFLYIF